MIRNRAGSSLEGTVKLIVGIKGAGEIHCHENADIWLCVKGAEAPEKVNQDCVTCGLQEHQSGLCKAQKSNP